MPSRLHKALLPLLCVLAAGVPRPAPAESFHACAGFIDSLPATVSTQGTWCLRRDLATAVASGAAIEVTTNNVTLDCNHFKIGGLAAGSDTQATGIRAQDRLNVTVRNCTVRGFRRGTSLVGAGHAVLDSRFDQNTEVGIFVNGEGSLVQGNQVLDTGPRATCCPVGLWVNGNVTARIADNQVSGVTATTTVAAYGIVGYLVGGSIARNTITGVASTGTGEVNGISNLSPSARVAIRDNDIAFMPQATTGSPIRCNGGTAKDNIAQGHANALHTCVDGGGNSIVP